MRFFPVIFFLFLFNRSSAQDNFIPYCIEVTLDYRDWASFLRKNLELDSVTVSNIPPGRYTVIVAFKIQRDGRIIHARVDTDPGYGLGEKVLEVVKQYKTKRCDPDALEVYRMQPITFVIEEEEDECLTDNTSNI
jgi:hypothetical protein